MRLSHGVTHQGFDLVNPELSEHPISVFFESWGNGVLGKYLTAAQIYRARGPKSESHAIR